MSGFVLFCLCLCLCLCFSFFVFCGLSRFVLGISIFASWFYSLFGCRENRGEEKGMMFGIGGAFAVFLGWESRKFLDLEV